MCLHKNETDVANYCKLFKLKETNVCPQQNNYLLALSRNLDTIKKYSKTIQWIKSRNFDAIGDQ